MAAANPRRGQLGFEVDGKTWVLAFTTNALCAIEDEFDLKDISELQIVLQDAKSIRTIRKLFRLGLTDCAPEMNDADAGQLIDAIGGLEPSMELVMRAIEQAFPEAAKNGTANPPTPAGARGRGTGPNSTRAGARSGGTPNSSGG
jgi:hypothetical protein